MELINQLAEQYAVSFSSPEDALTGEVSAFTTQTHPHAHMLSGHAQGAFLRATPGRPSITVCSRLTAEARLSEANR